jgi:hypothetical protein
MEEQVVDISCNMAFLMEALENKFGPFVEVGGSNSEFGLDKKSRDKEYLENKPKREQRKRNQVLVSSLLHNICLKWKKKWTSNPIKVILILCEVESLATIVIILFQCQ